MCLSWDWNVYYTSGQWGDGEGWCGQRGCKAISGQLSWRNPSTAGSESLWTLGAADRVGTDTWTHLRLCPGWPCPALSSSAQPGQARPHWFQPKGIETKLQSQEFWAMEVMSAGGEAQCVQSPRRCLFRGPCLWVWSAAIMHFPLTLWVYVLGTYVYVCVHVYVCCRLVCLVCFPWKMKS